MADRARASMCRLINVRIRCFYLTVFEPAYVDIDALQTSCIEEGEEGLCNTLQYVLLELPPGLVDARGCMCLSLFVDIAWFVHPCVRTEDIM